MALTRTKKALVTKNLTEKWKKAQSVFFAHYIGLTVGDISLLRRRLKERDAEMTVAKKTLMRRAAKDAGAPCPADGDLPGPVACIFSFTDPIAGPQVAFAFGTHHPHVALIGGIFDGRVLTGREALAFAQIPPRPTLLQTFAGLCQAPLRGLASVCNAPLQSFATALQERSKQLPHP